MRISEAAKETGLSVSNIRFYEKKGLLTPARQEDSKYRDYTEEDISRLKRIILYRKMNVPVEMIYLIQSGEASPQTVLERQLEELKEQRDMLQGAIDLCGRILEEPDPEWIDVDYYLNYVKEEETKGRRFAQTEEFLDDAADFYGITRFRGDPWVGRLLTNVWVVRGITVLWLLICVGLPVVEIREKLISGNGMRQTGILFWILWFVFMTWPFYKFRKWKAKNDL